MPCPQRSPSTSASTPPSRWSPATSTACSPGTCPATPAPPPTQSGGTSSTTPAPCTSPQTTSPSTSPCAATTPSSSTPATPTSQYPSPGGTATGPCDTDSRPAEQPGNLNRFSAPRIEVSARGEGRPGAASRQPPQERRPVPARSGGAHWV